MAKVHGCKLMGHIQITAGRLRGRKIVTPQGKQTRPTSIRSRQSLFDVIDARWPELLRARHFVDCYAGSGAVGFEAYSRGASRLSFLEHDNAACRIIACNQKNLRLLDDAMCLHGDVLTLLPRVLCDETIGIVFADPPYREDCARSLLEIWAGTSIDHNQLFILQIPPVASTDVVYERVSKTHEHRVGQALFCIYKHKR
ncbi:MAG: RsmD family RNA methyltransferase [Pseudomonadota bacterium]